MDKIVLVGFGGHGRSVSDTIERCGEFEIVGYTDKQRSKIDNGYDYLGTDDVLKELYAQGVKNAFVSIGQIGVDTIRHNIYKSLKAIGYCLPIVVDPSAIVADNSVIGEGTFIGKNVVINSNTEIGKMCIINTDVLCEHDNHVGDFCHLAVRATCSGTVCIGDNSFVGANATLIHGITVGCDSVVGAGSLVLHDVDDGCKVYGIV